jgi:cell division transport system permease protein
MSRILRYFLAEALTSMRRGLGISLLAVATISIALTILGVFLYFSGNLSTVVRRWSEEVQVSIYLEDDIRPEVRQALEARLQQETAVEAIMFIPKEVALERFQSDFSELGGLADLLDANPLPASFEVRLQPEHRTPETLERFARSFEIPAG